jgi:parallel beta-helix repeat protein
VLQSYTSSPATVTARGHRVDKTTELPKGSRESFHCQNKPGEESKMRAAKTTKNRLPVVTGPIPLLIASIFLLLPSTAVESATILVDQDGFATEQNCNKKSSPADATTINGGIAAASANDTVLVCPGTYTETVNVDKAVTVRAAKKRNVVVIGAPRAFLITADNATVEGFEARSPAGGGGDVILVYAADHVTVQDNLLTGSGPFTTTSSQNPKIPNAGVSLLISDQVTVEGNKIRDTTGFGIWVGSTTGSVIRDNSITDSQFTGIVLPDWENNGPSSGNTVEKNRIKRAGNQSTVPDDGIRLDQGAFDNMVRYNIVTDSVWSGIKATSSTVDNSFVGNSMSGSLGLDGGFDAWDQSTGSHTAGTANFWSGNICVSQSPTGLCEAE